MRLPEQAERAGGQAFMQARNMCWVLGAVKKGRLGETPLVAATRVR